MNKLIAIVGMSGSGKSVATKYLEDKGFNKIYFGGVILDHMKKNNVEITPENEKKYRESLRKKHGMGVVATLLLDDIKASLEQNDTVLDGLYSWDEYIILKKEFPELNMVSIICDKQLRYERISKRLDRPFNEAEIIKRDISEIENLAKGGPIAYADYYVVNNGSLDQYIENIEKVIQKIERSK